MFWTCAVCSGVFSHFPDFQRGVHFPTRDDARAMGFHLKEPKPMEHLKELTEEQARMRQAILDAADRAIVTAGKCRDEKLHHFAAAWENVAIDLRRGVELQTRAWRGGLGSQADGSVVIESEPRNVNPTGRVENLFTGKLESPHEPAPGSPSSKHAIARKSVRGRRK